MPKISSPARTILQKHVGPDASSGRASEARQGFGGRDGVKNRPGRARPGRGEGTRPYVERGECQII